MKYCSAVYQIQNCFIIYTNTKLNTCFHGMVLNNYDNFIVKMNSTFFYSKPVWLTGCHA